MKLERLALAGLLLPLLFSTGCRSFEKDYAAAAKTDSGTDPVAGVWQGHWVSEKNGHRGGLKAILLPAGKARYDARFKATFWKIFSASYRVRLRVTETNMTEKQLTGSADLGWLAGGSYEYEATADGQAFEAAYRSKADHGRFEMERDLNSAE